MNLSTAFIDTIKHDKSKIFRAFVREDIKMPLESIGTSAMSLADKLRGVGRGICIKAAKKLSKMKEDGVEETFSKAKGEVIESAMALAQDLQAAREKADKEELKETFAKAKEHASAAKGVLTGVVGRYRQAFDTFINEIKSELDDSKTEEEKIFYILKVLLYCTSFLIGFYLGNSIPDKDIKLFGIGKHRSALTHSIIPAIFIKLLAKLMFRLVDAVYAKVGDGEDGKETLALIKRNLGIMAGGASLGVSYHVFKDAFIDGFKSVNIGFRGTLVYDTKYDDIAFLAVNSFFSALIGKELIVDARHEARKSAA